MAVRLVSIWQPNPGRVPEFIQHAATAKKILSRLGGESTLSQAVVGGQVPNSWIFVTVVPDMSAYAKLSDSLGTDAEWQAFVMNVLGAADPAAALIANSLVQEVPI